MFEIKTFYDIYQNEYTLVLLGLWRMDFLKLELPSKCPRLEVYISV